MGRYADRCGQDGQGKQGSPGTGIKVALGHHLGRRLGHLLCHSLGHPLCHSLGHLLCDGLGHRLFMVTITRLARVKEEMGDREGAEDLRQEACESC